MSSFDVQMMGWNLGYDSLTRRTAKPHQIPTIDGQSRELIRGYWDGIADRLDREIKPKYPFRRRKRISMDEASYLIQQSNRYSDPIGWDSIDDPMNEESIGPEPIRAYPTYQAPYVPLWEE